MLYDSRHADLSGSKAVASVRFSWDPLLVDLRREVCPRASWQKASRQWIMSDRDAEAFVRAAHSRLDCLRSQAQIRVDDFIWVVGFARGAPYRLSSGTAA